MALSRRHKDVAYACKHKIQEYWRLRKHKFIQPKVVVHDDTAEIFSDMENGWPMRVKEVVLCR